MATQAPQSTGGGWRRSVLHDTLADAFSRAPHTTPLAQPADIRAAPAERGPALDPAAVAELQELLDRGPAQAIAEIGAILLDYVPSQLAEIRQALARQDAGAIARGAHALKSSSGSAAARPMAQLCGDLEHLGRAGELAGAAAKFAEVEAEFARVEAAIKAAIADAAMQS